PITKEVIVEIPKPVYKIVEVENIVQKPKIKVEEVTQTVVKPVFSIKQETIVLDQIQKKLDETVAVATSKLSALNSIIKEQRSELESSKTELTGLQKEINALRILVLTSAGLSLVTVIVSLLR
ncbi:hypothetical protein EB169_10315, partial [archaeon]|nr:hypothetical protein [archaeon]